MMPPPSDKSIGGEKWGRTWPDFTLELLQARPEMIIETPIVGDVTCGQFAMLQADDENHFEE